MEPKEIVAAFMRLFRGRENFYGQFVELPNGDKKVTTERRELTEEIWKNHLRGQGPYLGVIPIRDDNHCYWGAIDCDDKRIDHIGLYHKVQKAGLPLVVCRSKSGGAHLYLFLSDPAPAALVIQKLKEWAIYLKINRNPDGRDIEIFPKQEVINPGDIGNWINLPYYNVNNTNRFAYVNEHPATVADFIEHAQSKTITANMLEAFEINLESQLFEAPPCLQILDTMGVPAGTRNSTLFNMALYFKLVDPDNWQTRLERYNIENVDPAMSATELAGIIKSANRPGKTYSYTCKNQPLVSYCDKIKCKKRVYGISAFRDEKSNPLPEVQGLCKIDTDPPKWQVTLQGKVLTLDTAQLMSFSHFRKIALEKLNVMLPSVKPHEWDGLISQLLENVTLIEAPEDAGVLGQFKTYVYAFLSKRRVAVDRADLLRGLPWEHEGKVYFRSMDLYAELTNRYKFRQYNQNEIWMALRDMGAGKHEFNVHKMFVRVWWLPVPENEQGEPFEQPMPSAEDF
jgi:hypothetical protein